MCTAVSLLSGDFYFGRNLDYEFSYGDEVTVTPRGYTFPMRGHAPLRTRYAIIGMAYVQGDYPLYYDAINEKGLGVAGLNFVGNAVYFPAQAERDNVTQFELIPWLLGQCATLCEARELLGRINLLNEPFSPELPLAQLHWLIADQTGSITVESTADGLHVYDNPVGVLTNNPPFPMQLFQLNNYMALSPGISEEHVRPGCAADDVQPRHGRDGASGRPVQPIPFRPRRLHARALPVQADGGKPRQSVLPHPHLCGTAARLLLAGRRQIRNHTVFKLLQRHPGHLLLHHL